MTPDLLSKLAPDALAKIAGRALEHDLGKLQQLAEIVPEEQANAVRRHITFEIPWEAALEGLTLRSSEQEDSAKPTEAAEGPASAPSAMGTAEQPARATAEPAGHPEPAPGVTKRFESWPIEKLKPNKFNAKLFPDSLSESSIAEMAADLAKNGQRVAVEVTPDGTIVDGERRYLGAQKHGLARVDVIVGPELSDDQMLDRVIDACTSARQMTIREQVHVYVAVIEQLQRHAGRLAHRPKKVMPEGITYLTPHSIQEAARKRAGFSSAKQAVRAEAIFTRGSPEQQTDVLDGSLTITAAYEKLPKRAKKKATTPRHAKPDTNVGGVGGDPGAPNDDHVSGLLPQPTTPDLPRSPASPRENVHQDDPNREEAPSLTVEPEEEAHIEEEELADPALDIDDEEEEAATVTTHVNAICAHVSRLAEQDYDEAAIWLDVVVEQMRASLGDRPDSVEVEHEDDGFDEFDELRDL